MVALLSVVIASLFLPFGALNKFQIARDEVLDNISNIDLVQEAKADTQSGECNVVVSNFLNADKSIRVSKNKVSKAEEFDILFEGKVNPILGSQCQTSGSNSYVASLYLYDAGIGCALNVVGAYNYRVSTQVPLVKVGNDFVFRKKIVGASIEKFFKGSSWGGADSFCLYAYWHKAVNTPSKMEYLEYADYINLSTLSSNPVTDQLPDITEKCNFDQCFVVDNRESMSAEKLGIKFLNQDGKGLRDLYRVAMTDSSPITFGVTKGLDGIQIDWADGSPKLAANQYIMLNARNDTTIIPNQDPQYKYTNVIFAYADSKWDGSKACQGAYIDNETCDVLFYSGSEKNKDKGERDLNAAQKVLATSPVTLNPVLKPAAWKSKVTATKSNNGEALGKVEFFATPILWAVGGLSGSGSIYVMGKTPPKFAIEVYENETQIIEACKKENPSDESKCTPDFARYGIGKVIEQSTGSSETDADSTLAGDLFGFLRKVIAYIILLMTSIMYYIFAYILVPVLNALLKIQPYRDEFVNVIYPGWVIIRNISNIAFIIALLVMGLRILFQQEDASKSRGFIVTLVLMALLVNFSLVIGQGIVGIADTVQSQFLPAKSKVVEALGQKLMVDPIKTFRGGDDNLTSSGNFDTEAAASDLFKPIALWVLAGAAFWSFVALIAFMFIRLVALWVLYMLSPLAYVGRILPETRTYANQWWSHFLKYAFTVPILAFFLNITALVAVTFSGRMGDVIKSTGTFAGELTEFALTVISHFIVLLFLFIGMKFALSFGGAGAKQVVDFAKKGMDWTTRKGPQALGRWGKDTGADWAAGKLDKSGRTGLATALRSAARPVDAMKAFKKGYFDKPKELMNKRFTDDFEKRSKQIQPWGEDKLFPLKWAAWKLTGRGAEPTLRKAENLKRMGTIKDDDEITDITDKRTVDQAKLDQLNRGEMSIDDAKTHLSTLEEKVLEAEQVALSADPMQRAAKWAEHDALADHRDRLKTTVESAETAGIDHIDINNPDVSAAIAEVHNVDDEKDEIQARITNADEILREDSDKRTETGFRGRMDDDERKKIMQEAAKLTALADDRSRPYSKALEKEDALDVLKEKKEIADLDLDYDQLEQGMLGALKRNNIVQAKAYMKQMAENGLMRKFLESQGKQYNSAGLQEWVKENVKGSGRSQVQFIRDVSGSAAKNGNLPLGFSVKSLANGGAMIRDHDDQMADVSKKMQKMGVKDVKEDDISFVNPRTGTESATPGLKEWVESYNTVEKSKQIKRDMSKKVAGAILDKLSDNDKESIKRGGRHVIEALHDAARRPIT